MFIDKNMFNFYHNLLGYDFVGSNAKHFVIKMSNSYYFLYIVLELEFFLKLWIISNINGNHNILGKKPKSLNFSIIDTFNNKFTNIISHSKYFCDYFIKTISFVFFYKFILRNFPIVTNNIKIQSIKSTSKIVLIITINLI